MLFLYKPTIRFPRPSCNSSSIVIGSILYACNYYCLYLKLHQGKCNNLLYQEQDMLVCVFQQLKVAQSKAELHTRYHLQHNSNQWTKMDFSNVAGLNHYR